MLDLKKMLEAGIHFGHKTSRWNPSMSTYIWGARNKVHLIDVAKTAFLMERTGRYLKRIAAEGKSFLWIGTKKPARKIIKETAGSLKMPYVINRWIGGSLSNFDQIKKAITKLLYLRESLDKATRHYKKKELSMIQKEIERLERNIGGIMDLKYPPAAIIIVDAKKEQSAIKEAKGLGIPIIAMVDTNTRPDGINFVIPSNDDSVRSIQFIMDYLADSVKEGQKLFQEEKDKKKVVTTKKASVKTTSKPVAKAPVKATSKPEAKAPVKASAKPEVKAPVKATAKPAAETKTKETESVKKTESKTESKKVEAKKETKTEKKPAAKTTTKSADKKAVKKDTK